MKNGCVLLAGGRGSRMGGVNKAALEYEGGTFADKIVRELSDTGLPCFISQAAYEQTVPEGWKAVSDEDFGQGTENAGPMGGIVSCLKAAEKDGLDGLFFVPCDAPFFSRAEIDALGSMIGPQTDAACWRTADGRLQTTYGWYSVRCADVFERDLRLGRKKLMKALDNVRLSIADTSEHDIDDRIFTNVNTPEDYSRL